MPKQTEVDQLISAVSLEMRQDFREGRHIMSFGEYMQAVADHPERHARSAAQYFRDVFDFFGASQVDTPAGTMRRFDLFDGLKSGHHYLIGHEVAQNSIYRIITNFIREGRTNRLVLLHGPNGSAKTSLVACIAQALEEYSATDEGCLYRFSWIFPTEKVSTSNIGFGEARSPDTSSLPSYAYLDEIQINARLSDELRDSPLFLLTPNKRLELLKKLFEKHSIPLTECGQPYQEGNEAKDGFTLSDHIRSGQLSHKNKQIFDALLAAYHGELAEVLKHVQVQRFYLSRRYREGLATVGPQMRVDAGLRQLTSDRSLTALPTSLQSLSLFEPFGDLVDGNRGMVEFNDLLKRPMDLNRYLLGTSETGSVPLDNQTLHLDTVLCGTANETYLDALKTQPDWASYKGRIELIRMPYLLDYKAEQRIYDVQLEMIDIEKPVAPHTTELAALWAVLTRLTPPDPGRYPKQLKDPISKMTPLQKARLLAEGKLVEDLTSEQARELKAAIKDMLEEGKTTPQYEGRTGASPREVKSILLDVAQSDEHKCFSPLGLFTELKRLVEDPSVYEFLQLEPRGDFCRPDTYVDVITDVYLDQVDHEVRSAMGLVEHAQYEQLFSKYVTHVNHWVQKEKMLDSVSGKYVPADEKFMSEVEAKLGVDTDTENYRHSIISHVGAFRVEHPDDAVDFFRIFRRQLDVLQAKFFEESREAIQKIKMNLLRYFDGDVDDLDRNDREQVERTISSLLNEFGYTEQTAREAIGFLIRRRYEKTS